MTDFLGEHLTGRINLDGNTYRKCQFRDADLVYSGGDTPVMEHCNLERCRFTFDGAAARTVGFLAAMYAGGFKSHVEPTLRFIQGPQA